MPKTNNEDLITPAVNYWVQFLSNGDMGVERELSGMGAAFMLLARASSRTTAQSSEVDKFKETLSDMLREELAAGNDWIYMSTDYGPEGLLRDAFEKSGVRGGANFPLKDSVSISVEKGTVTQDQVRGRSQILYSRNPEAAPATPTDALIQHAEKPKLPATQLTEATGERVKPLLREGPD